MLADQLRLLQHRLRRLLLLVGWVSVYAQNSFEYNPDLRSHQLPDRQSMVKLQRLDQVSGGCYGHKMGTMGVISSAEPNCELCTAWFKRERSTRLAQV